MWEKINTEIKNHCSQCSKKDACLKNKCVVYRIRNLTLGIFDSSKINIDEFFEKENESQISLFDGLWGDEI